MADEAIRRAQRAGANTLAERRRAGLIERQPVALAAYLGDARAQALGVAPWTPEPGLYQGVGAVLRQGGLERRFVARYACDLAERSVVLCWQGGPEPAAAIAAARAWCDSDQEPARPSGEGEATKALFASKTTNDPAAQNAAAAAGLAFTATTQHRPEHHYRLDAAHVAEFCRSAPPDDPGFPARHLARCLLEPEWPDWRET